MQVFVPLVNGKGIGYTLAMTIRAHRHDCRFWNYRFDGEELFSPAGRFIGRYTTRLAAARAAFWDAISDGAGEDFVWAAEQDSGPSWFDEPEFGEL